MARWRYIAQRVLTGEYLDLDVPIDVTELSWTLSGAGQLRGTVSPDTGRVRAADGNPVLDPWRTLIYAEADGEIRWGGIVVNTSFDGETWSVEAASFSTYPNGLIYDNDRTWFQTDPNFLVLELWANAQYRPEARLGVLVVTDPTTARIGWEGTAPTTLLKTDYSEIEVQSPVQITKVDGENWVKLQAAGWVFNRPDELRPPDRRAVNGRDDPLVDQLQEQGWRPERITSTADPRPDIKWMYPPLTEVDPDPAALHWYDTVDIGQKVDQLAKETPFDYVESHFWVPNGAVTYVEDVPEDLATWLRSNGWKSGALPGALYRPAGRPVADEIAHVIRTRFPRAGSQRDDLAFVQGINIVDVVAPQLDGDTYANSVIGVGAGEGPTLLRQEKGAPDGRLYRPHLYSDKAINQADTLRAIMDIELAAHRSLLEIEEVTVRDHPNAPIGSWQLGDDVLIQADLPWLGSVEVWSRIVGWSLLTEDTARLQLLRSDSFTYGGVLRG